MQSIGSAEEQLHQLSQVALVCHQNLVEFWICINSSFEAITGADRWSGRLCCDLPWSTPCRSACNKARSRNDLGRNCRSIAEPAFFNCLDRQDVSDRCCSDTPSSRCKAVCRALFIQDSITASQRSAVENLCNPGIMSCIMNSTSTIPTAHPTDGLPCCSKSTDEMCQKKCEEALHSLTSEEDIVDEIVQHCGAPNPANPLWRCFLRGSTNSLRTQYQRSSSVGVTGVDGVKLLCCSKAATRRCRDLCVKTYGKSWTAYWNQFQENCGYHPREGELRTCLVEVEQPCKLGCRGLDYCTNFNERPTEMFRSCNVEADAGARRDVMLWQNGIISLPALQELPVKDIRRCHPELWKAIACSLQVKPCHTGSHATTICKADCLYVLSDCLDTALLTEGTTAESVCTALSPDDTKCISLQSYLVSSPHKEDASDVTHPCRLDPCSEGELCIINRRKCNNPGQCKSYICQPGCPLGEVSSFHVVPNSYVRVPTASPNQLHCHRVCRCGHRGTLHNCQEPECVSPSHCLLGSGRIQDHESQFYIDCNRCVCFAGEVVCTRRQCLRPSASKMEREQHTGLPCNCEAIFVPVCGSNGRTYPSTCVARCVGLKDGQMELGPCAFKDPCATASCPETSRCVIRRQVCLTPAKTRCKQYKCISLEDSCSHHRDPVCDTTGQEFSNTCLLLASGRLIAYRGHCLSGCRSVGTVCGVNGETYPSECTAWSDHVPVDYWSTCHAVGQLVNRVGSVFETECADVQCPRLSTTSFCAAITPPGACCPLCAGEIRILYSKSRMKRVSRQAKVGAIAVHNVTSILSRHMTTAECDVFGYLSIEDDLVLLVMLVVEEPTPLQARACMMETKRVATLISTNNPVLMSHLALSPFLTATVRTSHILVSSSAATTRWQSSQQAASVVVLSVLVLALLGR